MVKGKRKIIYIIADTLKIAVLIGLALVCILPMWHVLMGAISDPIALTASKNFHFIPAGKVSFEGWKIVFAKNTIIRGYLNTIFYTVSSTLIGTLLALLGAYVLSRNTKLKIPFFIFLIIPMFVGAGIIPFYIVVYNLGMTNTPLAMIIPGCCGVFNIILLRAGIVGLPDSILEAAEIDGARHMTVLLRIVLPLIVPYIGVVMMFSVIGHWNSWLFASIFISAARKDLYPLALILRDILIRGNTQDITGGSGIVVDFYKDSIQLVTILASSLPLIIAFPFFQKNFEKAVILGGVKG